MLLCAKIKPFEGAEHSDMPRTQDEPSSYGNGHTETSAPVE